MKFWMYEGRILANGTHLINCPECPSCQCPEDCPDCCETLLLVISGFTGACAIWNGEYTFNKSVGACSYDLDTTDTPFVSGVLQCNGTQWELSIDCWSQGAIITSTRAMPPDYCVPEDANWVLQGGDCSEDPDCSGQQATGEFSCLLTCPTDCPLCCDEYTLEISGFTGDCDAFNGTYTFTRTGTECGYGLASQPGTEFSAGGLTCTDGVWTIELDCPLGGAIVAKRPNRAVDEGCPPTSGTWYFEMLGVDCPYDCTDQTGDGALSCTEGPCDGDDCTDCPTGLTPDSLQAVISGITSCADCLVGGEPYMSGIAYWKWGAGFDLSGTVCLSQDAVDPCVWGPEDFGNADIDVYEDEDCNTFVETIQGQGRITIYRFAGYWLVQVQHSVYGFPILNVTFYDDECYNEFLTTDPGGSCTGETANYGGVVTVTPCCL